MRPFPGFDLTVGQSGEYVRLLQGYLNVISDTYPEIPSVEVDGVFGAATEEAVRAFQGTFALPETGIVGISTWEAIGDLYEDLVKGNAVSEGQYPSEESFR